MILTFGRCELDTQTYVLRVGGEPVEVEPRVLDLVLFFCRNPERLLTKQEILETVWAGAAVSDSVLSRCVTLARRAIGDDGRNQKLIQTVHGRGYRFVAQLTAREDRTTAPGIAETPFVGREALLEGLFEDLDQVSSGRGLLRVVTGEPGIGKTRLTQELSRRAGAQGFETLYARTYEGAGAPAFWLWTQILRACRDQLPPEAHGLARDSLPPALGRLDPTRRSGGESPETADADPQSSRFEMFEAVAQLLERVSASHPLLVVLEDLNWADAGSIRLLAFLAQRLRARRILLLGTYRNVELRGDHPLVEGVAEFSREPGYRELRLERLGHSEIEALVTQLPDHSTSLELASTLFNLSSGNPFFLTQLLQQVTLDGRVSDLSQGVIGTVRGRMSQLPDDCVEALAVASVVGRDFEVPVLARALEIEATQVLTRMDAAAGAGFVTPSGAARYRFSHALVAQCLYEDLPRTRQVELHGRIGRILEERMGETSEGLARVANHFYENAAGGDAAAALVFCERAARDSLERSAFEESARQYARALEMVEVAEPANEARRCELLIAKADAELCAGEQERSRETLERAAAIAKRLARWDLAARAADGALGPVWTINADERYRGLLEDALEMLPESELGLRSRFLSDLLLLPPYALSEESRLGMSSEALELAEKDGDPIVLGNALRARYWALLGTTRVAELLELGDRLLSLANARTTRSWSRTNLDPDFSGHLIRYSTFLTLADPQGLAHEAEQLQLAIVRLKQPMYDWYGLFVRIGQAMCEGRWEDVAQHQKELLRYRQFVTTERMYHSQCLLTALQSGPYEESLRIHGPYVAEDRVIRDAAAALTGVFMHAEGKLEEARGLYNQTSYNDLPSGEDWLMFATLGVEIAELDPREAGLMRERLLPFERYAASMQTLHYCFGSVAGALGQLEHILEMDTAELHFEAALEMDSRINARPALVRDLFYYARFQRDAGRSAKARSLLTAAQKLADEVRMPRRQREIAAFKKRL